MRKFPPVSRDLAFTVPKDTSYKEFEKAVFSFKGRKHLNSVSPFDVYEGEQVDKDQKSIAASYCFQASNRTLTDKEVDKEIMALVKSLGTALGAKQR